jgi:hypothetical protein
MPLPLPPASFSGNHIYNEGAWAMARTLRVNTTLHTVDLSNNSIRLSVVHELKKIMALRNSKPGATELVISLKGDLSDYYFIPLFYLYLPQLGFPLHSTPLTD